MSETTDDPIHFIQDAISNLRDSLPEEDLANWSFLDEPAPTLEYDRRKFCFTGDFAIAERSKLSEFVNSLGAIAVPSVSRDLDYLVVGSTISLGWKHGSYGNKIERAISERERRSDERFPGPAIISEIHFLTQALEYHRALGRNIEFEIKR